MSIESAEYKSLVLPSRGNIEPMVWDEKKPFDNPKGWSCDVYKCKNKPTHWFNIIFGKEGQESYEEMVMCDEHEDDVIYYFKESYEQGE